MKTFKDRALSIKNYDFLGKKFTFSHRGDPIHRTVCGGLCTLLLFLIAGLLIFLVLQEYTLRITIPKFGFIQEAHQDGDREVDFNKYMYLPFIVAMQKRRGKFNRLDLDSHLTVLIRITSSVSVERTIYYRLCNDSSILHTKYRKYVGSALCIQEEQPIEKYFTNLHINDQGELTSNTVRFEVYPCSESNKNKCIGEDTLRDLSLTFIEPVPKFDLHSRDFPLVITYREVRLPKILSNLTQYSKKYFTKGKIRDSTIEYLGYLYEREYLLVNDRQFLISNRLKNDAYCTREQIDSRECSPYITISYNPEAYTETITRNYPKLFFTLSKIGGAINLGLLLTAYLYVCCKKSMYRNYLRRTFIKRHPVEYTKFFAERLIPKNVENISNDLLARRSEAKEYFRRLISIELISEIFFKDVHKVLIPLLMTKRKEILNKYSGDKKLQKLFSALRYFMRTNCQDHAFLYLLKDSLKNRNNRELQQHFNLYFFRMLSPVVLKYWRQFDIGLKCQQLGVGHRIIQILFDKVDRIERDYKYSPQINSNLLSSSKLHLPIISIPPEIILEVEAEHSLPSQILDGSLLQVLFSDSKYKIDCTDTHLPLKVPSFRTNNLKDIKSKKI